MTVSSSSSIICLPLQHAMTEDWDCDPNGKQLDGEYLNINPGEKDYYSLVSLELWPPMTCPRGKTVPNSMTSVGLRPKKRPVTRHTSLWLVNEQRSSLLIGWFRKFKWGHPVFPLRTGPWLMSPLPQTFLSESNWKQHKSFYFWIILSASKYLGAKNSQIKFESLFISEFPSLKRGQIEQ